MSEAVIILANMRGGCATVGNTVHALFRVSDRRRPVPTSDDARRQDGSQSMSPAATTEPASTRQA